jgi:hypothetical protein
MKFQAPNNNDISGALSELLDEALIKKRESEPPRKYLGASLIGHFCERYLGYQFHKTPSDEPQFAGKTFRIFDMGHDGEERFAEYLRLAGFDLHTHKPNGGQYGWVAGKDAEGNDQIKGHIDGIIVDGRQIEGLSYPCIWEHKALGSKSWKDVVAKGVKESKPVYYAQMQINAAYLDVPTSLFTAMNRDTGEIYAEVVGFDARHAQELSDKAVRVVTSSNPNELPQGGHNATDFRCKWCAWRVTCWDAPQVKVEAQPTPIWLTNLGAKSE